MRFHLSWDWLMMAITKITRHGVKEKEFIKTHKIIQIERNDVLLLTLSELMKVGGFKVYVDMIPSGNIFFFVGNINEKIAYTKIFKSESAQEGSGSNERD